MCVNLSGLTLTKFCTISTVLSSLSDVTITICSNLGYTQLKNLDKVSSALQAMVHTVTNLFKLIL